MQAIADCIEKLLRQASEVCCGICDICEYQVTEQGNDTAWRRFVLCFGYYAALGRYMKMARITLDVDDALLDAAVRVINDAGFDLETVMKRLLRQVVSCGLLPSYANDGTFIDKELAELERRYAGIQAGTAMLVEHDLMEVE